MKVNNLTDTYTLNNGIKMPAVGFGTYQVEQGDAAYHAVLSALQAGYRHIDTAQGYGNEESVGRAIKDSGIPREEIFITSKLSNGIRGYQDTLLAFEESLRKLGTDYMDLFLLHWPRPAKYKDNWEEMNAQSWRAMEDLHKEGKLKALGISNFHPHHMDALLKIANIKPAVNQIRLCPGDTQDQVVAHSRRHGMLLSAYSPLGVGKVSQVPQITEIAKRLGKSEAQVSLRWSLQKGFNPLPKSATPERIIENTQLFDFELSDEDMAKIDALHAVAGLSHDPDDISW